MTTGSGLFFCPLPSRHTIFEREALLLSATLEAAIGYIRRGWPVLAISPNSKIPVKDSTLQPNGSLSATLDEAVATELFTLYPKANIAIATGEKSFTAIDPDGPHGPGLFKQHGISPPRTTVVKTPNGHHIYVTYDAALQQGARLLEAGDECDCAKKCGVDVRNAGGYVLAPPSAIGEAPYKWLADTELEPWPEATAVMQARRKARGSSPRDEWADKPSWVSELLVKGAPEGQRNDAASRLAGYFRSVNVPRDITLATLKQFADACQPHFDYGELEQVVNSVWRFAPSQQKFSYQGLELEPPLEDVSIGTRRIYRWPAQDLYVLVDRISESKRGIDCELTVNTGSGTLFGPIHFDLMSENKRTGLVRALKDRKEFNWSAVIQHVAFLVRRSLRDIEQVIDLGRHRIRAEQGWHLEPFLRSKTPTLIYGHGGVGKSILCLAMAVSVATGKAIIPGATVHEQGNVLYLDVESDEDDHAQVLKMLCDGAGVEVPTDSLFYWRMKPPLIQNIDWLVEKVSELDIKLVVIDSVVGAGMPADPFSPESAMNYKMAHQFLNVSVIGVSHVSAEELRKKAPRPYGSVYFWDWSRACWLIKGQQESGSVINQMSISNEKANRGKQEPVILDVNFTPEAIRYSRGDKFTSPVAAIDAWEAVHHLLVRYGAMHRSEIYDELVGDADSKSGDALGGHTRESIKKAIQRRMGKNFVETPDGKVGALIRTQGDASPVSPGTVPSGWGTGEGDRGGGIYPPVPSGPPVPSEGPGRRKTDDEEETDQPHWARG